MHPLSKWALDTRAQAREQRRLAREADWLEPDEAKRAESHAADLDGLVDVLTVRQPVRS